MSPLNRPSDRLKNNLEILKELEQYLKKNPDVRFSQALRNLKIVSEDTLDYGMLNNFIHWKDEFNLESSELLLRVKFAALNPFIKKHICLGIKVAAEQMGTLLPEPKGEDK